jgi:hypothetical protein
LHRQHHLNIGLRGFKQRAKVKISEYGHKIADLHDPAEFLLWEEEQTLAQH